MSSRDANRLLRHAEFGRELRASEDLWVRPLLAFGPLLREFGVDERAVLRRSRIDPATFDDPFNRLPFDAVGRFAQECSSATGCPHFGLLVGQRSGIAAAGIVGELARHSKTVGAGLRVLIAHLHLQDRGGIVALTVGHGGHAELAYVIHHPRTTGATHIMDAAIAIAFSIMRGLCGRQWHPSEVTLSRDRPPDVTPYRSYFRAPVRFNAARSALIFPAQYLDQPAIGADSSEEARLIELVEKLEAARPRTIAEQVVRALSQTAIAASPSFDLVARIVGLHPRTLRRRLDAEGTSFRELRDVVRFELARQLLVESRMPIGEIAATLHYSTPSAFTRAYRTTTGMRPLQVRRLAARPRGRRGLVAALRSARG